MTTRRFSFAAIITALVVVGLVFLAGPLAYVAVYGEPEGHLLRGVLSLVEKLGDALLIAAILAVFVERALAHEDFNHLIVQVFGRRLPPKLVDHIQTYFQWDFVRTNWNIVYTIERKADSEDFTLRATSSYEMENVSDGPQVYSYRYSVEVGPNGLAPTRIERVVIDDKEQRDIERKITTDKGYVKFADTLTLQPKRKYKFASESVQAFRNEKTSPYWALHPVVGATFTIFYPGDLGVDFDATFEDESTDPKDVDDKKNVGLVGKRWTIETPILPGHGFLVRCAKPPAA